jgi:hypothetical protein
MKYFRITIKTLLYSPLVLLALVFYLLLNVFNRIMYWISTFFKNVMRDYIEEMKKETKNTPIEGYFDRMDIDDN